MNRDLIQSVESTIKAMMDKVYLNIAKLKSNNEKLQLIISREPFSAESQALKSENKELLNENSELIKLQSELRNYLKNNKLKLIDNSKDPNVIEYDADELFDLTISGELKINEDYPGFHDEKFMNRLMDYYMENEEYEKCELINKFSKLNIANNEI